MRSSPITAALIAALALTGCANSGTGITPSAAVPLYSFDGISESWCDRIDFKLMAVVPGELSRSYLTTRATADELSCTKVVSGDSPENQLIINVIATVHKSAEIAKAVHEQHSSPENPLSVRPDVSANLSITDDWRTAHAVHRNLRLKVWLNGEKGGFASHEKAVDEALPRFVAHVLDALGGSASKAT
jgi:hypothetical protein